MFPAHRKEQTTSFRRKTQIRSPPRTNLRKTPSKAGTQASVGPEESPGGRCLNLMHHQPNPWELAETHQGPSERTSSKMFGTRGSVWRNVLGVVLILTLLRHVACTYALGAPQVAKNAPKRQTKMGFWRSTEDGTWLRTTTMKHRHLPRSQEERNETTNRRPVLPVLRNFPR